MSGNTQVYGHAPSNDHIHDHVTEQGEHIISTDAKLTDIASWLKRGWQDMAEAPGISLFYGAIMALSVLLVFLSFRHNPIHMFTIATVFVMLSPFLATGLYYTAKQLEAGEKPKLFDSMVSWKANAGDIGFYAAVLGVITAAWAIFTPLLAAIVAQSHGLLIVDPSLGLMGFVLSEAGLTFMTYFALLAIALTAFVFTISVVTIPLLMKDKNIGAVQAMIISFQISMENKLVMAAWATVIAVLLAVAIFSLGLGMLIVMPLLGYASWHAFNDLVKIVPASK
ncbi:DUF2189 domain-containing protein [Thiomicrospira sp. ALE5]|uniref:DUF2189 domain-containing protein n=1 Tax=Thiomicrospira sp. ALE5 TaxID=748650 RepID=UPI0008EE701B|nr:DUF2189 domain-containing protein [Thiomicrospira sp. ALE5]SFR53475.1 Uncharacterized membrane protein [Thiomicrospira sp. ALE5]